VTGKVLPSVAVVIPTSGKRAETLAVCIGRVLEDPAATEVVVAADVPAHEPLPVVPRDPRVKVLRVPAGLSRGADRGQRARDLAVGRATTEVILALDDDVVAARGLVTAHASRHARTHDLVVMGYTPVAQSGLELRNRPAARYFGCTYEDACRRFDLLPRTTLEGFWGLHFSVRRLDWLRVRGARRLSCRYHDDLEHGLLLARAGLQGTFDRSLRAEHRYRRTLRELSADSEAAASDRLKLHSLYPHEVPYPRSPQRRVAARIALGTVGTLASQDAAWRPMRGAIVVAVYTAEALRARRAADLLVRILCRIAFERSLRHTGVAAEPAPGPGVALVPSPPRDPP
jgi:hypothetical protein